MQKILVPTDFSPLASYATSAAVQIAGKTGAEVILLHVVEMPGASFSVTGQQIDSDEFDLYTLKLIAKTKEDLVKVVSAYEDDKVKLVSSLHIGNAYQAIAQAITEQEVDLVVMGSHGASGWEETFVGSNAEKVVRRSSCPVLVIKQKFDLNEIKSIIFAADFNEDNHVIDRVKATQEILGAKLHLVKINTPANFLSDHISKETMMEFADIHQLHNYTINVYNDKQEENGIIYFADEVDADLIALGTHGRTGLQNLLSSSIAESVTNHSKRPVWTCKIT